MRGCFGENRFDLLKGRVEAIGVGVHLVKRDSDFKLIRHRLSSIEQQHLGAVPIGEDVDFLIQQLLKFGGNIGGGNFAQQIVNFHVGRFLGR